jgi:hypothetical protein
MSKRKRCSNFTSSRGRVNNKRYQEEERAAEDLRRTKSKNLTSTFLINQQRNDAEAVALQQFVKSSILREPVCIYS